MQIEYIEYLIPENRVGMDELIEQGVLVKQEAKIIERVMGLKKIPRDSVSTHYRNIEKLIKNCVSKYSLNLLNVKYILLSHTATEIAPLSISHFASMMHEFGFCNAFCFGSTINKCAAPFHFFQLSQTLFKSLGDREVILLIQSDCVFTSILQAIPGSTLMGDASSLVVLSKAQKEHCVIDILINVDPRFHHGVFSEKAENLLFQACYIETIVNLIGQIIVRNNLILSDIKLVIPHNVNVISWKTIAQRLSVSLDQFYLENIPILGHCFGSDPFINLKDALNQNRFEKNDYYLMLSVGLGATFAAMLCQY